jgi:hypothetical protein
LLRTHERLDAGEPTQITASVNLELIADLDKLSRALGQSLIEDKKTVDVTPSQDDKKT